MRRRVRIYKMAGRWWWECTLCRPAYIGSTATWTLTLRNVQRHLRYQRQHHDFVRRSKS